MIIVTERSDGTEVKAGNKVLTCITKATPRDAIERFIILATQHDEELTTLGVEYIHYRQLNFDSNGRGKDWPVFRKFERLVGKLLREAGVVDS